MHSEINAIINDLPDDAQAPSLNKFSLILPIMTIGANGKMDEVAFYDLVDKKISVFLKPWCSTSKYYWWTREKFKLI
jgi:multidrug efflux pump subunit AcrB